MTKKFGIFTQEEALIAGVTERNIFDRKPFFILGTREDGRRWIASEHASRSAARKALAQWLARYPDHIEG